MGDERVNSLGFVSPRQAARLTSYSPALVTYEIRHGRLQATRIGPRLYGITREDLVAWARRKGVELE